MDHTLADTIYSSFKKRFGSEPRLTWSPGRINIIGEHTDYNLGYVLPAAIDLGMVLAIRKADSGSGKWVANDLGQEYTPGMKEENSTQHKGWTAYFLGILQELSKKGIQIEPFNLVFGGNIPPGAGLSSSAALENAFVFGLNELYQLGLSRMDMVLISHAAEQNYVGVRCGIMDQYIGMFGQAGKAVFLDCQSLTDQQIHLETGDYQWLLIDSRVKHSLADSAYNERQRTCESVARLCGVSSLREVTPAMLDEIRPNLSKGDYSKARFVLEENSRVLKAVEAIRNGDLTALGKLMYASHMGLKEQYEVSCEELDFLVDKARGSEGVLGARMMGGGFGGCTLNLLKKDTARSFISNMQHEYSRRFGKPILYYGVNLSEGCHRIHPTME